MLVALPNKKLAGLWPAVVDGASRLPWGRFDVWPVSRREYTAAPQAVP